MKNFLIIAAVLSCSAGAALAQSTTPVVTNPVTTSAPGTAHDVTGFSAHNAPAVSPESTNRPPNPHVVLKPRAGGIFVDGAKYGTNLINPTAGPEWGMGEKYLAAPDARYDVDRQSGPSAHRDAGGLKLLSFEF